MKNFFSYAFILLTLVSSCASSKNVLLKEVNPKPVIKKITEFSYKPKSDSILLSRDSLFSNDNITNTKYNSDGRICEHTRYKANGSLSYKMEYIFSAPRTFLYSIKRNPNNKIIEKNYYEYDSQGELAIVNTFDGDSILTRQQLTKYENNRNTELIIINVKRGDTSKYWHKYDDRGNHVEMITGEANRGNLRKRTYVYGENENQIAQYLYMKNGDIKKVFSKYDEFNNVITYFEYSEKSKKPKLKHYTYTYDNHNNWITMKSYSDEKLVSVKERKIEYH